MRPDPTRTTAYPTESDDDGRLRVLIAGGGVAAVEALLALRALAGERVKIGMLAPDPRFRYRPLSVTEPFGLGISRDLDLLEIALEHGATFLRDALAAVDVEARHVATKGGRILSYDVLLVATGTRGTEAVPGALTFRDSADRDSMGDLVADLDRGRVRRVAFAVPSNVSWPLGLYELALLCAARVREVELSGVELTLVTPESRPLEIFGPRAAEVVGRMLEAAGIAVRLAVSPIAFEQGELRMTGQAPLACDRVVALPKLGVPLLSGSPRSVTASSPLTGSAPSWRRNGSSPPAT